MVVWLPEWAGSCMTVEEIRAFHTLTEIEQAVEKRGGWWTDRSQRLQDRLATGDPICDERGFKTEEWRS